MHIIDRFPEGVGWIADPKETMERASHAIKGDHGVWLIDPVDAYGLDELLAAEGNVAGVVITLNRHRRDSEALAGRYGVSIYLPEQLGALADDIRYGVRGVDEFGRDTGWTVDPVIDRRGWHEVMLVAPDRETVRISEAVGTAPHFCAPGEKLGVHPLLRLFPPRGVLGDIVADRILVGHGEGVLSDGASLLADTLEHARRRAPKAYARALWTFLP